MRALRLFSLGLALTVGVLVLASAGLGQVRVQIVPGGLGGAVPLLAPQGIEKLQLTSEQKEKYAKIEKEFKNGQKAASDKLQQVIQGKDREKIKEAFQTARTDAEKLRNDHLAKVEALLTADQKTTFQQVRREQPRPAGFRPLVPGVGGQVLPPAVQEKLKLTDEQRKKINDLQKDLENKIMDVLTPEQRKQFDELKKTGAGVIIRPAARPNNP